jgi:hypothetical protein
MQAIVIERHPVKLTALEPACEPLESSVEFGRLCRQPFLRRPGEPEVCRDGRNSSGGKKVTIETAIAGRAFDPDVA